MKIQKSQLANMNIIYKFFSFDYFLDHTERMGYEGIEILPHCPHFYIEDLTLSEMKAIKQKIKDHHLKVVCYTPDQCSYPHNIAYNSEVSRQRTLRNLEKQLEVAALLECDQMLSTSGYGYFWAFSAARRKKRVSTLCWNPSAPMRPIWSPICPL